MINKVIYFISKIHVVFAWLVSKEFRETRNFDYSEYSSGILFSVFLYMNLYSLKLLVEAFIGSEILWLSFLNDKIIISILALVFFASMALIAKRRIEDSLQWFFSLRKKSQRTYVIGSIVWMILSFIAYFTCLHYWDKKVLLGL